MGLRRYQEVASAHLLSHPRAILGDAPGSGKTPTVCASLSRAGAAHTLVVAPRAVVPHWEDELARWYPDAVVIDGRGDSTHRAMARAAVAGGVLDGHRVPPPATVLLLNYEAMRQDVDELVKLGFSHLVADEAHRIKNRQAVQTKAAWKLARRAGTCWLVTGTPIPNRPDEAWSLLHALDPARWPSFWRWVEEHMYTDLASFRRVARQVRVIVGLRPGAVEAIHAQLSDVMIQRSIEELLPDLPPVTMTTIPVELDAEERRLYDELRRRHWTRLGDGAVVTTVNEVSRITRYRQIVSDVDSLGAGRTRPGSKIVAALSLIEDLGEEQVVVLTWSRAAADRIASEVGDGAGVVHGGVATADRQGVLDSFKAGEIRVLCGTLATLGEGVDGLQAARHIVLLDRPWKPSEEEQAIGRVRRSGQQRDAVFAWSLVARNTIDVHINKLLDQKRSVIQAIRQGEMPTP